MKKKPNLFIIGSMRAGTTSLHNMLAQHPDIFMSKEEKEPGFFFAEAMRWNLRQPGCTDSQKAELEKQLDKSLRTKKYRTQETYASLFYPAKEQSIIGESSHYLYNSDTAPLIKQFNPTARIVVSLRNPTERMISEYGLRRRSGHFKGSFDEFVWPEGKKAESLRMLKGLQAKLLQPWMDAFGSSVYFLNFDDFKAKPEKSVYSIFDWLGLPQSAIKTVRAQPSGVPKNEAVARFVERGGGFLRKKLKHLLPRQTTLRIKGFFYTSSLYKELDVPIDSKKRLVEYYHDDVKKLEKITGFDLDRWKSV